MTSNEIMEKFLQGGKLAIERLIEKKRKEDGYIVIGREGKVIKLRARDIKP